MKIRFCNKFICVAFGYGVGRIGIRPTPYPKATHMNLLGGLQLEERYTYAPITSRWMPQKQNAIQLNA